MRKSKQRLMQLPHCQARSHLLAFINHGLISGQLRFFAHTEGGLNNKNIPKNVLSNLADVYTASANLRDTAKRFVLQSRVNRQ